ncbi:MAG: hypothetical protein CBC35_08130 [Planctomycetes bacterium TMED75]|nr:phosphoribosyltransferase [Planctomycetaceae bacterium]OUU92051.1 MAG: hypothetical protein CBC35_08130 [Planctomycetes bacterium TMED75]
MKSEINMSEEHAQVETRTILRECGALLLEDHFVYASGDHGSGWIAKDLVNIDARRPQRLGALLARACREILPSPTIVCGPAVGGMICAQCTSFAMELPFVYAERSMVEGHSTFELRRGFTELVTGQEVLVVDDVVNTGFSIGLVIEAVRAAGGSVHTAATWINRGNTDAAGLGVEHFVFLDQIALPAWPGASCPLCAQGFPVNTRYAHGAEFVEATRG